VWYFIEDEAIYPTDRTVGQAHHASTMLSDTDWKLLKTWINACEEHHRDTCISPGAIDFAGFEVIDCKTREIRPARDGEEFAALSYVWGNWNAHQVLSKQAFLPDNLAEKVIEDALSCTANLGIPCLWVDRYCIDQEESSHDSKQQLIQNMDKVYSAARVTIISVAGVDARNGLPGVSSVPRLPLSRASICGRRAVQVSNPNEQIAKSRWASRGWTLQEGLLARRRLIFTNTQVYFQCNKTHCIETVSGMLNSDQDLDAHGGPFTDLRDFRLRIQVFPNSSVGSSSFTAEKVCNEFSRRVLTKDEDALEACLGIFSRLWEGTSPVYQYWGLPFHSISEKSFITALLWGAERIGHYARPTRRAQIPSWSWVAWKGYVGFGRPGTTPDTRQAQLLIRIRVQNIAQEQPSTIAEYVQDINSGGTFERWLPYLELTGWIFTVRLGTHAHGPHNFCLFMKSGPGCIGVAKLMLGMLSENEARGSLVSILLIAHDANNIYRGLILRRASSSVSEEFERLGTCRITHDGEMVQEGRAGPYVVVYERFHENFDTEIKPHTLRCEQRTIRLV
jgi:hypothetical protein